MIRKSQENPILKPIPTIQCDGCEISFCLETGDIIKNNVDKPRPYLIKYDPTATAPIWNKLLWEIFRYGKEPDKMIRHLHEFLGWLAFPLGDFRVNWILVGGENSGKFEVMRIAQWFSTNERRRFVDVSGDTPDPYKKTNVHTKSQHIPFWRTGKPIPEMIITRIIANELPGILNQIIGGIQNVIRREHLSPPLECHHAKKEWAMKISPIGRFLQSQCYITDDESIITRGSEIYECYQRWESKHKIFLARRKFYSEIRTIGVKSIVDCDDLVLFFGICSKVKTVCPVEKGAE